MRYVPYLIVATIAASGCGSSVCGEMDDFADACPHAVSSNEETCKDEAHKDCNDDDVDAFKAYFDCEKKADCGGSSDAVDCVRELSKLSEACAATFE